MGINNQQGQPAAYALVAMTNKDTYYLNQATADMLMSLLEGEHPEFVRFTDARSGAKISVAVHNISSVVLKVAE